MYELVNHLAPSYLYLLVSHPNQQQYNLRNTRNLPLIFGTNSMYTNSFFPNAVREYTKLSIDLRQSTSKVHPENNLIKFKNPNAPPKYYNTGYRTTA